MQCIILGVNNIWARGPNQEGKKFASRITANTYILYLYIINHNALSSVVPILER